MTLTEFSDEFDIQFNSIAGASAPSIDIYEKSVYLTKAQLEIIKNKYTPKSNRLQEGFDLTEKRRRDLHTLIKRVELTTFNNSQYGKIVKLPDDLFLIVREDSIITIPNCGDKIVDVIPTTFDKYNNDRKNPFRKSNSRKVLKLDNSEGVELISEYPVKVYIVDYIKNPSPIIIEDLSIVFPGEGLTIDGQYLPSECQLHKNTHPEILNRAVELALGDYKPQGLQVKASLDQRDE